MSERDEREDGQGLEDRLKAEKLVRKEQHVGGE
jgi:hypothetical protein